jgi:predicted transcriptional regulator of viral defense system
MNLVKKRKTASVRKGRKQRDLSRPLPQRPENLRAYLDVLQASGRYTFTRVEAAKALGLSDIALKNALWRLARTGRVASPRRGFYAIVPPEYRVAGSLPAAWFIRDLMEYLGRPYYVGLLTAASLHGAAHQAPQEFQVVTDRPFGVIEIGRVRIRFVKKVHLPRTPTIGVKTPTGEMRTSTPEATALDLVRYPEHCGGLSNVATVLQELAERLDGAELVRVAEADGEVAYAQRLGYLLDRAGRQEVARALAEWVDARSPRVTPLSPGAAITGAKRDARWRVAVNEEVDLEAKA